MGINLKLMEEKIRSLNSKGKGGSSKKGGKRYWNPEPGKAGGDVVRVLPSPDEDPFKEFYFHYGLGDNAGILCPKRNFDKKCPICEFASKLYRESQDKKDDVIFEEAKKLFAKNRFYTAILVRGREDEGAFIWGFGKTVYENFLQLVMNPHYGDITHPETGEDVQVTSKMEGKKLFPTTTIMPIPVRTPLLESKDKCKEILDAYPDFSKLFILKTTEEIEEILESYLSPSSEDGLEISPSSEDKPSTEDKSLTTEEDAIDAAYKDLQNG
ncbi:hypothetical protein M0R19_04110 [Candidatus Pacearchaeota archaeon]|nr:hypothetical protein [Candidatus Pacearchaeota archaeon]